MPPQWTLWSPCMWTGTSQTFAAPPNLISHLMVSSSLFCVMFRRLPCPVAQSRVCIGQLSPWCPWRRSHHEVPSLLPCCPTCTHTRTQTCDSGEQAAGHACLLAWWCHFDIMHDLWPFSFRKRIPEIQWKYTNTNLFTHGLGPRWTAHTHFHRSTARRLGPQHSARALCVLTPVLFRNRSTVLWFLYIFQSSPCHLRLFLF